MQAVYYHGNRTFEVGNCLVQEPKRGEVRVEVAYCGICGTDLHIYHGHMDSRVKIPQVIGHEMSGVIVETGEGVDDFSSGDRVVVRPLDSCGTCPACHAGHSHICENLNFIGIDSPGAFQCFWTVPAKTLHKLPEGIDMREAALVEPLAVACHDVRLGEVRAEERVLVIGGGPIGMLVALVAQSKGADVTLSEINAFRTGLAEKLGLVTINPEERDLARQVNTWTGGAGVDAVFEVSGSAAGISSATEVCRTRGRIVIVAIFPQPQPVDLFRFFWRELRMLGVRVYEPEDFEESIRFVASGALPLRSLITDIHPLKEAASVFQRLSSDPSHVKVLIDCGNG